MDRNNVLLKTPREAFYFLESLKKSDYSEGEISLGEALVELKVLIEGDAYSGKLTGELAKALGLYQDAIYNFAKIFIFNNPNARLTIKQKKELELLIDVNEGSLNLKVSFEKLFDALKEPLSKMSPIAAYSLLISLALIATLGITSYTLGGKALDNADRSQQREHVHEMLKTTLDSQNETLDKALSLLEENLKRESQTNHDFAIAALNNLASVQSYGLTEIAKAVPDAEKLSFGESKLDKNAIESLTQRSPRALAEQFNGEGLYHVLAETLPSGTAKVTFYGADLPGEITADFIENEFTKQQSDALWNAIRNHTKIKVKLQATLIRDTVKGGVLIDIIAND